jgi:hypothetical protein
MVMTVLLQRICNTVEETLGVLFIDGKPMCFVLEDQPQPVKVMGETRIPAGTYRLSLKTSGTHHIQYAQKFPEIHKGMILVNGVPNFTDILFHIGNTDRDTEGCLLLADSAEFYQDIQGRVRLKLPSNSTQAYKRIYPMIADAILGDPKGAILWISFDAAKFVSLA